MPVAFGQYQYTALRPTSTHQTGPAVSISVPEDASMVLVQPIGANVRVKVDGGTATPSAGFQVADGTAQYFPVAGRTTISIVAESGTPNLQYQFFS
jgi:hypothetical protein